MTAVLEDPPVVPSTPDPAPRRRNTPLRQLAADLRGFGEVRRSPYGVVPVVLLTALGFFQGFDSQAFALAVPEFVKHGLSVATIITITVEIGIVALFAGLFIGWYADRHKRVPIMAALNLLSGVGAALTARRFTIGSVGGARVADDGLQQAGDVPVPSLLSDYYPVEVRGRTFAFQATLSRLSALVAIIVAPLMLIHLGLALSFEIFGAAIVVVSILLVVILPEPIRGYFERRYAGAPENIAVIEDEPQSFGEGWRTAFSVRTLRRLFVADIVIGFTEPYFLFAPLFLAEKYGLGILARGYIAIPAVVTGFIGGIYGGGLVDRFTRRNPGRVLTVYGLFYLASAVGVAGYALRPPLALIIAFTAVTAFGRSLVGPALRAVYSQVVPPSIRTQGLQVVNLASVPTFLFGFPIAGILQAQYGYATMFWYFVPIYVLGGMIAASAGNFFDVDRRNALAATLAAEEFRRAEEAGTAKMLVLRAVDVSYEGGVQVLFGVDLDVDEGEIIALLGTNGAGKSTVLRAISGTREASGGAIVFNGRDITHMPPHEIAARGIVHMPGGRGVFPGLSVRDNLLLGNWLPDDGDRAARVAEVLEMFPMLRTRADEPAGALSGGQQQQLSLAQAFLMKPKLLMIDELSLGLSPAVVGELLDVIRRIHASGVTIVVVEQSVNVALNLATRAVFMEKGQVKFDGATAELLGRPDILRAVYVKGTGALTDVAQARGERDRRTLALGQAREILQVDGVSKHFGGVVALDEMSLTLREGEILGLIGPNGSGKTTFFDVISGFTTPDAGSVVYDGVDITALSPEERARRRLVRRFQDAKLFPSLTVFETLLVSLEQRAEVRSTFLAAVGAPQARRAERRLRIRADRLIELLELGAFRDKFVKELSTGLRRIVDLACVLAAEPRVLLLDEPSAGIAQAEAEGLGPLLKRVQFETGCSILIIEHDMPLISALSDELVAMEQGSFVVRGAPELVLNDERVITAYLGGSEAAINRSGALS